MTDLSPHGLRLAAGTCLHEGEAVVVSFTPPGWWLFGELDVFARVVRSEPRHGSASASMGLEFLDLPRGARAALAHGLRGMPPPLPTERRKASEMVWVDLLVTYTEDLGDRVNTFEVSEVMGAIEVEHLAPRSLGTLLTGGQPSGPVWRHAA